MSRVGPDRTILCIDVGSSSLKLAVYAIGSGERRLLDGGVEAYGEASATLWIRDERTQSQSVMRRLIGKGSAVAIVPELFSELGVDIAAIGHRLVDGGPDHETPALVTAEVLRDLAALVAFDPLHLRDALAAIRTLEHRLPRVPQVVCFDTAFHRSMPAVAQRLPLPRELRSEGVRRYGFHGLSYESIVRQLGPAGCRGSMIVAHLGIGASLAAIRNGKSVDTSMGFSPLGGIMMGTRPGDLDPGILLHLLRDDRRTPAQLEDIVTRQSGLRGVSGSSADMHVLLQQRGQDPAAAEAVELFVYLAKKQIGALAATLGGLDMLVFAGGIGAHAAAVRAEIAAGLEFLGLRLNAERNAAGEHVISADQSPVTIRVMETNENLMLALHTWSTVFGSHAHSALLAP